MDIVDLIVNIARDYKERIGIAPAKTKLLKLVYLAEAYYKRLTGERLTDQEWVFWKYGPYFWEYEAVISNEAIFVKPDQADDFYPIEVKDDYQTKEMSLEEQNAIIRALEHASDDLNQILDFVYFDTEPMMKAQTRGETLDFGSVMPEEFYSIKQYKIDKKQGQQIILSGLGGEDHGQAPLQLLRAQQGQLPIWERIRRAGADGLPGVCGPGDLSYSRQRPGHGALLWPLCQRPSGEGAQVRGRAA